MELGVGYFPTPDGVRPGEIARRVEERGWGEVGAAIAELLGR